MNCSTDAEIMSATWHVKWALMASCNQGTVQFNFVKLKVLYL